MSAEIKGLTGVLKSSVASAGKSVLTKLVTSAMDSFLSTIGVHLSGGGDGEYAEISEQLQQIMDEVADLKNLLAQYSFATQMQDIDEKTIQINDSFGDVQTDLTYCKNQGFSKSDAINYLMNTQKTILEYNPQASADFIFQEMVGPLNTLLEQKWQAIMADTTKIDPMDMYAEMKGFSLRYQVALGCAASLLKFCAYFDPGLPVGARDSAASWAQAVNGNAYMIAASKIIGDPTSQDPATQLGYLDSWDQLVETGTSGTIMPEIIIRMAQYFLPVDGTGQLATTGGPLMVFWDRSGGWGIQLMRNQYWGETSPDMTPATGNFPMLVTPRPTSANDPTCTPLLTRNNNDGTYILHFEQETENAMFETLGFWSPSAPQYFQGSWLSSAVVVGGNSPQNAVPQPFTLERLFPAGPNNPDGDIDPDTDNIYYHLRLAAPASPGISSEGVTADGTNLSDWLFEATAPGSEMNYTKFIYCNNSNVIGQYDTQFAFRLAS